MTRNMIGTAFLLYEVLESSWANSAVVPVVLEEELDLPVVAINPDNGSTDVESMDATASRSSSCRALATS